MEAALEDSCNIISYVHGGISRINDTLPAVMNASAWLVMRRQTTN
jgi:hypothetical protein